MIKEKEWKITRKYSTEVEYFLVSDMKGLVNMYGLKSCKADQFCVFCKTTQSKARGFITCQKRTLSQMKSDAKKKKNGMKHEPLLDIPLENVIPCGLHAAIRVLERILKYIFQMSSAMEEKVPQRKKKNDETWVSFPDSLQKRLISIGITHWHQAKEKNGDFKKLP